MGNEMCVPVHTMHCIIMPWNAKEIVKTNKPKTGSLYTHTGCRESQLSLYKVACSSAPLAVVTDGLRDLYGAGWCS